MIPSIPYPAHPYPPFWGPPTASSNFCEEDYVITTYIAEFVNTITNITYVLYCSHGLYKLRSRGRLAWSTALPHIGLLGVGVFSAAFHITLREYPQLADDLSMIFPTAFILLRLLTFQSERPGLITAIFLGALLAIYTVHLNINNPHMHSITFGVMVHWIRVIVWGLLSTRVPDTNVRRKLKRMALFGISSFAWGFLLWVIDQLACSYVTRAKRVMGMPWSFLLEFHGWWHIFTGIGAYVFIVLGDYLTSEQAGKDPGDAFGWPAKQVVKLFEETEVVANEKATTNGKTSTNGMVGMNGEAKINGKSN